MENSNKIKGIELSNLDRSVSPKEDFYKYACGGWIESHPLPAEFSSFGVFTLLRENAREQLKELITGLGENPDSKVPGTVAQKIHDLYELGMDEERLNSEGAAPILPKIAEIENYPEGDLAGLLGKIHQLSGGSLFSCGVGPDLRNSDMNILHIGEAGIGLGDRDYYLVSSEENDRIMAAYKKYIKTLMLLVGKSEEDAQRIVDNVIELETFWAKNKKTREERRNPLLRCNMFTIDEFKAKFNNFDWERYFAGIGIETPESLNVSSLHFLEKINESIPQLRWQQIVDYLVYDVVSEGAGLLSDDFINAGFEFDKVVSGVEELQPRWKRAMALPNSMFGEAVGQLYVAKYFPPENKEYMKGLVENLRKALGMHIDALPWMSEETKAKAREKLAAINVKIGYPDKWKDYSEIKIDPSNSLFDNVVAASNWVFRDAMSKLGKPVDKSEWFMTPQTVNAYYSPMANEICFPAAILQPPYFNPEADDAMNYGAIGVIIGHEMTHGFDDSGRKFDKNGNLNDWWTEKDSEAFNALGDKLVAQFDAVEVAPGVNANGRYTLGENIADQGGLRIAMTAYGLVENPKTSDSDEFTPHQRFYLSYALPWADNIRPEEILVRTKTDPHSLGRNRVNVTLRNLAPFFEAFGITEEDKMYRPENERVIIW